MARRRTATATAPATDKIDWDNLPDAEDKPRAAFKRRVDAPAEEGIQPRRVEGWEAVEELFTGNSDLDRKKELRLKLDEDNTLIKFLANPPFAVVASHWVDEISEGRKSFRCAGADAGCPLCDDLDNKPRKFAAFHVGAWDPDAKRWDYRVWEAGTTVLKKLRALAADERKGPLDNPRLYVEAKRLGTGLKTEYFVDPIRESDALEDWECTPLKGEALDDLKSDLFEGDWMPEEQDGKLDEVVDMVLQTPAPRAAKSDSRKGGYTEEPPF
ncbi:hypothetical protein [Streptomyces sp. NBC_00470]|uniref:hypothetical protein n=1 Tax=Streptomyces sp. NBC_00470 TaxID=2975753 RepID=UPI0030E39FD2